MKGLLGVLAPLVALLFALSATAQDRNEKRREAFKALEWQVGPTEGRIAGKATIKVPQGYMFLDSKNTKKLLELTGNLPEDENYFFGPSDFSWWSVFRFEATGYVKDDEKIDADALMKTMKESDGPANEERKRLGLQPLQTVGWQVPPHYDSETKRLEWGVKLRSASGETINYTSRLLGRTGVMSAILVADPQTLTQNTASFKAALQDYSYVSGEKYAEFKQGDKVAQYGLAALILGGAAAVATKKGFWAAIAAFLGAFWKVIVGVGIAALAGLKALFKGKSTTPQ